MQSPSTPEQRLVRGQRQLNPGVTGGVRSTSPARPNRGQTSRPTTSPVLHVGTSAPTGDEVFWYDTDETC